MFGSRQLSLPVAVGITVLSACSTATTRAPGASAPGASISTPANSASSTTTASADTGTTTLPSTVPTTTPAPSPAPMPGMPMPATSGDTAARSTVGASAAAAATNTTTSTGPSATAAMPMGNALMERQQLRLAVQSLNRARTELQRSTASYGGKKSSAVQNIEGALGELRSAGGPDPVNIAETTTEARVEGREIHLAVESLERARREMGSPSYMLGGHRASVLAAIDRALGDLRAAAEYEK